MDDGFTISFETPEDLSVWIIVFVVLFLALMGLQGGLRLLKQRGLHRREPGNMPDTPRPEGPNTDEQPESPRSAEHSGMNPKQRTIIVATLVACAVIWSGLGVWGAFRAAETTEYRSGSNLGGVTRIGSPIHLVARKETKVYRLSAIYRSEAVKLTLNYALPVVALFTTAAFVWAGGTKP